jgi:hypothetical protein
MICPLDYPVAVSAEFLTCNGGSATYSDRIVVKGTTQTNTISVLNGKLTIVLQNVTISILNAFSISSSTVVVIAAGSNYVESVQSSTATTAAIDCSFGSNVTIAGSVGAVRLSL